MGNPFRYKDWFNCQGDAASETGDDVEVGKQNIPDDRDTTMIFANTPENAAFMGIFVGETLSDPSGNPNNPPDAPGMGVYGEGKNPRGIGVGGACDTGTGVYGISEGTGIGVVGRSLAGGGCGRRTDRDACPRWSRCVGTLKLRHRCSRTWWPAADS
jgi:hypothetical protein